MQTSSNFTFELLSLIGDGLANFSRRYFFSLAVVVGAIVCAYDWTQYPFDRICEISSDIAEGKNVTNYTINGNGPFNSTVQEVPEGPKVSIFDSDEDICQDRWKVLTSFLTFSKFVEAPRSQEDWTQVYRSVAFLLVIGYIISTLGLRMWHFIKAWFIGSYKVSSL